MKTAELLSETDGTLLFRYSADEGLKEFTLFTYQYRSGKFSRRGQELSFCYNSGGFTRLFVKMSKSFLINFQDFFLRKNFRVILQV